MTAVRRGRKGRSLSVTPRGWRCRWGMGEAAVWRRTRPLWKRQTWRGERCSTWCTTVAGTSGKTGPGKKTNKKTNHLFWWSKHLWSGCCSGADASLTVDSAPSHPALWSVLWSRRTLGHLVAETEHRRDADDSTAFLTLTPPVCPSVSQLSIRQTGWPIGLINQWLCVNFPMANQIAAPLTSTSQPSPPSPCGSGLMQR